MRGNSLSNLIFKSCEDMSFHWRYATSKFLDQPRRIMFIGHATDAGVLIIAPW